MRLPKTVNICGKKYKVTTDNQRWGGACETGPQSICVGTKRNQSANRKFENFAHEVMESVLLERNLRFQASDNELVFVMTHKQFDDYASDVATALWPLVRNR